MKKFRFYLFIITLLLLSFCLNSAQIKIKQVGLIEETDKNPLYRITDVTVSEDKFIFVVNSKENTVSKYDWTGRFIKKIGQRGRGPGDFNKPMGIDYYKDKLYVSDNKNNRIVVLDKELNIKKFVKSDFLLMPQFNVYITKDLSFIGTVMPYFRSYDLNFIRVIDSKGKFTLSFFNKMPLWDKAKSKSTEFKSLLRGYSFLHLDINEERDKVIFTSRTPVNPAIFYIYSSKGKYLNEFIYPLEKGYKFPEPKLIKPEKRKGSEYVPRIHSVFFAGKRILVKISISRFLNNEWSSETKLILFDLNSKVISERKLIEEERGRLLHFTKDFHLLVAKVVDEEYQIRILKLELPIDD